MKFRVLLSVMAACLLVSGCIPGLQKMERAEFIQRPSEGKSLINFVRPSVFAGDGKDLDVWHGENHIGSLRAGSMIQYEVLPGEQIFLCSMYSNWAIAKGIVLENKVYYLKPNQGFGFISLGVADADDPRISKWENSLIPKKPQENSIRDIPNSYKVKIKELIKGLETGSSKYHHINESHARQK